MNHTSEELFSVFFSTVFESSCISDFTQKMASFFKRYMPVSAVYISFFEKDTIFKVAEYADYSKNSFPDQITIPEDTLRRMYIEDNFFTGDVHSIKTLRVKKPAYFLNSGTVFSTTKSLPASIFLSNIMSLKASIFTCPYTASERTDIHKKTSISVHSYSRCL